MGSSKARFALVALAAVLAAAIWLGFDGRRGERDGGGGAVRPLARRHAPESRSPEAAATLEPAVQTAAPDARAAPLAAARGAPARSSTLEPPMRLQGRVVLPAGAPIEPALTVVARGRANREHVETRAAVDAAGRFELELPSAPRRITVGLEARYLYLGSPVSVDLQDLPGELVLEPELGGRLLVRLIAPPGSDPARLAGVPVYIGSRGQMQTTHTVRTDESGEAYADALPAGTGLYVSPSMEDYLSASIVDEVVVPAGGERVVELAFEPAVRLSGLVRDELGRPVEGARVNPTISRIGSSGSTSTKLGPTTDAAGAFELRGLEPGQIRLRVEHPAHLAGELDLGELARGEEQEGIEIVLASGQRITGRLTWPDEVPAEDLWVLAEGPGQQGQGRRLEESAPHRARSAADGRFELGGLDGGPYVLTASARPRRDVQRRLVAAGHLDEASVSRPILLARVEDVPLGAEGIELVLVTGEAIRGRVLDSAGRLFERATLLVRRIEENGALQDPLVRAARLDDGAFELPGFQRGSYVLAASAGAGPGEAVRVEVPQAGAGALLVAPRGVRLEGRVLNEGEPASRADVSLNARHDSFSRDDFSGHVHSERWRRTRTDAEGRFEFEPVGPGSYYLEAETGRGKSSRHEVHISAGTTLARVLLEIEAAGWIEGRLDSSLAPLGGRRVRASQVGGDNFARATTDSQGRFLIAELLPGIYRIELRSEGQHEHGSRALLASAQVEVASGRAAPLVLLPPGGPVRLVLQVRSGGRPVAGQEVRAWLPGVGHRGVEGRSDFRGRMVLELPESGATSFEFGEDVGRGIREERWVPAQDEVHLVFDLPEGEISGLLVGRDGNPAPHARVILHPAPSSRTPGERWSEANAEGRFAFLHVGPGAYRLVAGGRARSSEAPEFEERYGQVVSEAFELAAGQRFGDLRLVLPAPATVQGSVRGGAGESWTIHAFRMDGSTRVRGGHAMVRDGRYRLSGLGPGPHDIEIGGGPSHRVRRVTLSEGQVLELDFNLD